MEEQRRRISSVPDLAEVEKERNRLKRRKEYGNALRGTCFSLLAVAAIAVLAATLFLPVLQVTGTSMEPTLYDGDIIVLTKKSSINRGDLCGFYYQNKLLLKRVIGLPGDWIDIKEDGTALVNDEEIDEPYVSGKSLGECDLTFPYQVPDNRYFVMGDHRSTSIDSRSSVIGSIEKDQITGKILLRIWPLKHISLVH